MSGRTTGSTKAISGRRTRLCAARQAPALSTPNPGAAAGGRVGANNVISSSRQASFLAIVARDGKIVWRMGPDFSESKELRAIRQVIGQHHAHFIPKGLPGAGNLLVFDNGGASGYGFTNPNAPDGANSFARANSRVLEINPVTLQLVWSYTGPRFYSSNISGAQRLPNDNTLITEGANGRLFEVTKGRKIVWEYMFPMFTGAQSTNAVYRGYRLPYDWIPQIERPKETHRRAAAARQLQDAVVFLPALELELLVELPVVRVLA